MERTKKKEQRTREKRKKGKPTKITKKLCKLAKIGYAAMSVIVEREDEEMNNHEPSKEIVVPHTWTL